MKGKMQERGSRHIPNVKRPRSWSYPAVILLVGLLPITWFRGLVIAGMDYPFPLADPHALLMETLSTWGDNLGLGVGSPSFRLLPYALVNAGLDYLGLSPMCRDGLLFVFWFMGAGLSAYCLVRVLVPNRPLAALIGGLFYMLNPYTMVVRWYELNLWQSFYAVVPLLLALYAAALRGTKLRYVLAFLLASLVMTPAHANVGSAALLGLVLGGYLATYLWLARREPHKIRHALRCSAIVVALWLGVSLWWIVPTLSSLRHEASLQQLQETTLDRVSFSSSQSSWDRVLRLQGYWAFDLKHSGTEDPIFPYAQAYGPAFRALGWLIPVLGALGLWKARRHPGLLWPTILWIGGSFFMKGLQPPFGALMQWLYETLPLPMSLFRHPFDKFGMMTVLGLAPLVGIGMENLGDLLCLILGRSRRECRPLRVALIGSAAFLLLGVVVWPFWTGDVIYGGGEVTPSLRTTVPPEYEQARSWLRDQRGEDSRVLPLPLNRGFWTFSLFNWYGGFDPTRWLLGWPVMAPSMYRGSEIVEPVVRDVLAGGDARLGRVLSLLNVKYVLLHDDANWSYLAVEESSHVSLPRERMREAVATNEAFQLEARFGGLSFYRNQAWRPLAAYATTIGVQAGAGESAYQALLAAASGPGDTVVCSEADANGLQLTVNSAQQGPPLLTYTLRRLKPWLAQLELESEGPFFVVLSQACDAGWKAYRGAPKWWEVLLGLSRPQGRHFLANGYANGWYFDQGGKEVLTLYYWPQTLLYVGLLGSAMAWGLVALACLFPHRVRRLVEGLFQALELPVCCVCRFLENAYLGARCRTKWAELHRLLASLAAGHSAVWRPAVVAIVATHIVLGLTYSMVNPLGEGYDEWAHFAYVRYLVMERKLPQSGQRLVPEIPFDETHQPPLYYLMGALASSGVDMSDNLRPVTNIHFQSLGGGQNVFVHSQAEDWPYRGSALGFHVVRVLSVLLSTVTILVGYLIALELLPGRRALATAALALTGFMPQLIFMGSIVNNDIAATMFTSLTALVLVQTAVRGCSAKRLVLLFVFVAGAVFSKANTLGLLLAVGIVLGFSLSGKAGREHRARMLATALLFFLGVLALILGWECWNVHMHTHPASIIGIVNRVLLPILKREANSGAATLHWDALLRAPEYAFRTFWGAFGWGNVPLDEWIYAALGILCAIGLMGDILFFVRRRALESRLGWLALALVALFTVLLPMGLLLVTGDLYAASAGRYMLPIAPTVGLLIALGVAELMPRRIGSVALWTCGLGMLALAAMVPLHYIRPVYARPPLVTADELAQLSHRVGVRFGGSLELVGYEARPDSPCPGDLVSISLYWRCLEKMEKNHSVIVQTLDPDFDFYGGVDTNLGFAEYPTSKWQVGDILKQTYQFRLGATFPSPGFARVKVAVSTVGDDQKLSATDPSGRPIEGQVTFGRLRVASLNGEITQVPEEFSASFGDAIRIRGYGLPAEIRVGEDCPVTLYWESFRPVDLDYTVFVHMVDEAGRIVAQADGQPLGGRYPTALWRPGEIIQDTHKLAVPSTAEPGRYRLLVGLYLLETMERLPASDEAGHPLPANQLALPEITVNVSWPASAVPSTTLDACEPTQSGPFAHTLAIGR